MEKTFLIGTRNSELAIWQANWVKELLWNKLQIQSKLIFVHSEGDANTVTPLYEMGIQGIFTKALDIALLKGEIDMAVHSLKDVPTRLAQGLQIAAVLPRASYNDILVFKNASVIDAWQLEKTLKKENKIYTQGIIATGSVRRKAQWLYRFPLHRIEPLRGNVNTRLKKLEESAWDGAIFAEAGLERIHKKPASHVVLNWMLPAPAQGAIGIVCKSDDDEVNKICAPLHNYETGICIEIERNFLMALAGGCSTPISALAQIEKNTLFFKGNVCSPSGETCIKIEKQYAFSQFNTQQLTNIAFEAAEEIKRKGAQSILNV